MKKIFILFCLLAIAKGFSQESDPLNIEQYEILLKDNVSSITIVTNKSAVNDKKLILKTHTKFRNYKFGLTLDFADGESIRFRDLALNTEEINRGNLVVSAEINLTEDLFAKLAAVNLNTFSLASLKVPVQYKQYDNLPELIKFIDAEK